MELKNIIRKILHGLILLLLVASFVLPFNTNPVYAASWYSKSWIYRKSVTVVNAVASYPTKILIGESSGAVGEEVDCNSHCQTDFDDLLFASSDGTTLLSYWIESISGATPNQLATVWVKNDATPSTVIYMYYGNSGAAATSNGTNTFTLFDDFEWGADEDDITTGTKIAWSKTVAGTSTAKVDTGQYYGATGKSLRLYRDGTNNPLAYFTKAMGTDYAIKFMWRKDDTSQPTMVHGNGTKCIYFYDAADEDICYWDTAEKDTGANATINAWQSYEISDINIATPKFDIWFQDAKIKDDAATFTNALANGLISFYDITGTSYVWIDNVIVRKWAATEPSLLNWTSETTYSTTSTSSAMGIVAFGLIEMNDTIETGLDVFEITNTGDIAIDITIQGTDMVGGTTWTLTDDASVGADTYGLKAGLESGSYNIVIRKTASFNPLKSNLGINATQKFGIKLYTPSSSTDGVRKTGTITLNITAH